MPDSDACPMPTPKRSSEQEAITALLKSKRIAVVGMSADPSRAGHYVPDFLRRARGREILPVNPNHSTVIGLKCYARLEDVPGPIDVVDVFRRPEYCAEVVQSAVAVGAKGVWLQSGITSDEARQIARKAGIDYVEDRCLKVDHMFAR